MTLAKHHVATVAACKKQSGDAFMVVSTQFGYPIYSADVPDEPEVEITDKASEAGKFGNLLAAQSMAKSMSWLFGYQFAVVPCAAS